MSETGRLDAMDDETSGGQHLEFTDAEINAAASIVCTMIKESVWEGDDWIIDAYERLLNVTANAKIRLRHELYHLPLDEEENQLINIEGN